MTRPRLMPGGRHTLTGGFPHSGHGVDKGQLRRRRVAETREHARKSKVPNHLKGSREGRMDGPEREVKNGGPGGPDGADGCGEEGVPTGGVSAPRRRRAGRVVNLDVLAVVRANAVHCRRDRARAGVPPTTVGRLAVVWEWAWPVRWTPAPVFGDAANTAFVAAARVAAATS